MHHCTDFVHHCTVFVHHCTVFVHHCTDFVHHCTDFVHHCTVFVHHCTGFVHHCTGFVHHCTGFVHHCTGFVHMCTNGLTEGGGRGQLRNGRFGRTWARAAESVQAGGRSADGEGMDKSPLASGPSPVVTQADSEAECEILDVTTGHGQLATGTPQAYQPIVARVPIVIRQATLDDLPFIDGLQKQNSKELGFLPRMALEGKILLKQVLVAECTGSDQATERRSDEGVRTGASGSVSAPSVASLFRRSVAYLIAADRYFKRDEVGYITQINVRADYRRSLVAAQLLQAQFDRSAYGCKLYSCWCAQDLKANAFWKSMGFTAIAFRTGSLKGRRHAGTEAMRNSGKNQNASASDPSVPKCPSASVPSPRVHIFWQKRIRPGDTTTPYWYPSQTGAGQMRADRLVMPIMPGVDWRDVSAIEITAMPVDRGQLPAVAHAESGDVSESATGTRSETTDHGQRATGTTAPKRSNKPKAAIPQPALMMRSPRLPGGLWFANEGVSTPVKTDSVVAAMTTAESTAPPKAAKAGRTKAKTEAIDPRLTAMARELRDKWSEQVATRAIDDEAGKYDLRRLPADHAGGVWPMVETAVLGGASPAMLPDLRRAA